MSPSAAAAAPPPIPPWARGPAAWRLGAPLALLLAVCVLDLVLPREVVLLPYYWVPLVLASTYASPRQLRALALLTLALALLSGWRWSMLAELDYWLRFAAWQLVALASLRLAAERQRGERRRRQSEQRYRLLAENASDVVFRASLEGVTEWISAQLTPLLGWAPEELIGQPFSCFVHPDDLPQLKRANAAFARGERQQFRLRVRRRQGGYRWLGVTARGVAATPGLEAGIVGSWRDLEAEVEAELATDQERSRLAATLDALLDPHVLMRARRDAAGTIVDFVFVLANDAACHYNQIERGQLIGRGMMELLPAHGPSGLLALYVRTVETGEPLVLDGFVFPHELRAQERHYDIRAVPLGDELSCTWRDVTERQEAVLRLAASEEAFRLLAENSSDVVLRLREDRFIWLSPSLTAGLGWRPEQWIGQPAAAFLHPDDQVAYASSVRAVAGGESVVSRHRLRAQNGTWHWVELHAGPYRDGQGRIDGLVATFRIIDAEVAAQRALERYARTDDLTGLLNRREVLARLDAQVPQQPRSGGQTAVLFCDLDRFKTINDRYGHAAGDQLLRTVADRLRHCLRAGDLAARVGGDELLVVLHGVQDLENAVAIAEKIRAAVGAPVPTGAGELQISLSIGVTLARPGEDSDALIARADAAMYEAKQIGRNRVIPIAI